MSGDILNQGYIVGQIIDSVTGQGVGNATAILTSIIGDSSLAPPRMYDASGNQSSTVTTDANSDGYYGLVFQWNALDLGSVAETDPPFHMSVIGPVVSAATPTVKPYQTNRITDGQLYQVVSLSSVISGGVPDVRSASSIAKTVAKEVYKIVRKAKLPTTNFMKPSPGLYGLLGYQNVSLVPLILTYGTGSQ